MTVRQVMPLDVNWRCPQPTFVSSSSISGTVGSADSIRSMNWRAADDVLPLFSAVSPDIFFRASSSSIACGGMLSWNVVERASIKKERSMSLLTAKRYNKN